MAFNLGTRVRKLYPVHCDRVLQKESDAMITLPKASHF